MSIDQVNMKEFDVDHCAHSKETGTTVTPSSFILFFLQRVCTYAYIDQARTARILYNNSNLNRKHNSTTICQTIKNFLSLMS